MRGSIHARYESTRYAGFHNTPTPTPTPATLILRGVFPRRSDIRNPGIPYGKRRGQNIAICACRSIRTRERIGPFPPNLFRMRNQQECSKQLTSADNIFYGKKMKSDWESIGFSSNIFWQSISFSSNIYVSKALAFHRISDTDS